MRKFFYLIVCIVFTYSCKTVIGDEYPEYVNKDGYKCVYIVDTFKIENPIRFFSKGDHSFIMSQKAFEAYDGDERSLFLRPDIFIYEDFVFRIPSEVYDKYIGDATADCDKFTKKLPSQKGIGRIYSYEQEPDFFLLVLIRGDYFNRVFTGIDGPYAIKLGKSKCLYYKIAIPCCRDRRKKIINVDSLRMDSLRKDSLIRKSLIAG